MNLKITLKDPKYCDGCPMMMSVDRGWNNQCMMTLLILEREQRKNSPPLKPRYIRPKKCIKENGE